MTAILALGLAVSGLVASGHQRASRNVPGLPAANGLKACPADGLPGFEHFYAGEGFGGLELSSVYRFCSGQQSPGRVNNVEYGYSCHIDAGESGCPLPMWIVSSPACEQNPVSPTGSGASPTPAKQITIRGAPAFLSSNPSEISLDIYSGDVQITIAATGYPNARRRPPAIVLSAARALRSGPPGLRLALGGTEEANLERFDQARDEQDAAGVVGYIGPGEPLPPPRPGVLSGKVSC